MVQARACVAYVCASGEGNGDAMLQSLDERHLVPMTKAP